MCVCKCVCECVRVERGREKQACEMAEAHLVHGQGAASHGQRKRLVIAKPRCQGFLGPAAPWLTQRQPRWPLPFPLSPSSRGCLGLEGNESGKPRPAKERSGHRVVKVVLGSTVGIAEKEAPVLGTD